MKRDGSLSGPGAVPRTSWPHSSAKNLTPEPESTHVGPANLWPWKIVYHDEGRQSSMAMTGSGRTELLQGTLDMLVLRTLRIGPAHGHAIAKHIQRTTEDVLQVEHGSLYPALHRLERRGLVSARWETARDQNRELKFYRLTVPGRRQLLTEESKWKRMTDAIARVMWPTEEEAK